MAAKHLEGQHEHTEDTALALHLAYEVTADWSSIAKRYGKMTAEVGEKPYESILSYANRMLPFDEATGILDNGCGPGPVMKKLIKNYPLPKDCPLTCADRNEDMIAKVNETKSQESQQNPDSPWARVRTMTQDATELGDIGDSTISHLLAGWVGGHSDPSFTNVLLIHYCRSTSLRQTQKNVCSNPCVSLNPMEY